MVSFERLAGFQFDFEHIGLKHLSFFEDSREEKVRRVNNAVVLARNGTGKSSIARLLSTDFERVQIITENGMVPLDTAENVFVFDETFVNSKVISAPADGLEPLVLIGGQADRALEIEEIEEEIDNGLTALGNMRGKISRIEKSVEDAMTAIETRLKEETGDASWLARSKRCNGPKKLTQAEIKKILDVDVLEVDLEQALLDFEDKSAKIQAASGGETAEWSWEDLDTPSTLEEVQRILRESPNRVADEESETASRIIASHLGLGQIERRLDEVFADRVTHCPECFQGLAEQYKTDVKRILEDLKSSLEADDLGQQAREATLATYPKWLIDLSFDDGGGIENLNDAIDNLNREIEKVNQALAEKADNPNRVDFEVSQEISSRISDVNSAASRVESLVARYNADVLKLRTLTEEARQLNRLISAVEVKALNEQRVERETRLSKKTDKFGEQNDRVEQLREKLHLLKADQNGEWEAANQINHLLRIVFGSNQIYLQPADVGYSVVNREESLSPGRLSTGERNILGLCYFLVSIAQEQKFREAFIRDQLIVLDDPISSFDSENRYGVFALLTYLFRLVNRDGSKTKLLLLTHDQSVATAVDRTLGNLASGQVASWRFDQQGLIWEEFSHLDVYRRLLSEMYEVFINSSSSEETEANDSEPTLTARHASLSSNDVRRVWEAFVHFEIGETATDASVSSRVRHYLIQANPDVGEFIDSYPGRVFVNPDSHSREQISGFKFELPPTLEEEDFGRYVKDTLCFMHMISPFHIPARLADGNQTADEIGKNLDEAVASLIGGVDPF